VRPWDGGYVAVCRLQGSVQALTLQGQEKALKLEAGRVNMLAWVPAWIDGDIEHGAY